MKQNQTSFELFLVFFLVSPLLMAIPVMLVYNIFNNTNEDNISKPVNVACPKKPTATLDINQVKSLTLTSTMTTVSGTVTNTENIGYIFTAKSGQRFLYDTPDEICFWVYSPDNTLLTQSMIPTNGRYVIQIASPSSDLKSFNLAMGLNVVNTAYREYLKMQYTEEQNSPKAFTINYYQKLNGGRYQETWSSLSPSFQLYSQNYSEYQRWWEKVEEIKIGRVETIEQSDNTAIVNIELWYLLREGREVYDQKKYVHLIWDKERSTWLIDSKKST